MNSIRKDRNLAEEQFGQTPKKGGRVCTYIKDGPEYKVNGIPDLSISIKDIEGQNFRVIKKNI